MSKQSVDDAMRAYHDTLYADENPEPAHPDVFLDSLVRGVVAHAAQIDERITKHAEHWRIERMPAVDRNILRLGIYEMMQGDIPAAVVIDEALELARRFSNEESVQFVNGVLDAVRKEADRPGSMGQAQE